VAFDLSLEPHQEQLQRAAQGLFSERCPRTTIREVEEGDVGYLPGLWQEMAGLGWLGLTLPAEYSGSGGSYLDLYVLYEEMGRYMVPGPHLDTVAIAGDLILDAGTEDQKRRILPEIASGRCIVSVATYEPSGTFDPSGISTAATPGGEGFVITGEKLLAGFAEVANYFLVTARVGGSGSDGVTVFLIDAASPGITLERLKNIAGAPLYAVAFNGVQAPPGDVVGDVGSGWPAFSRSATKAALLQTSAIVGAAREVLAMTNQYAKDREQFGTPIGIHQAVQYMVSDILIDLHTLDVLGKHAAYRVATDRSFEREAAMAIAHGKRAAAHLVRQAHEVHAGIGFMQEYDLQLFSRRSKYWENNLGDARYYDELVLEAISL
jgi:alkylation response protein AidB-like acyl-CoA dehydrogenase